MYLSLSISLLVPPHLTHFIRSTGLPPWSVASLLDALLPPSATAAERAAAARRFELPIDRRTGAATGAGTSGNGTGTGTGTDAGADENGSDDAEDEAESDASTSTAEFAASSSIAVAPTVADSSSSATSAPASLPTGPSSSASPPLLPSSVLYKLHYTAYDFLQQMKVTGRVVEEISAVVAPMLKRCGGGVGWQCDANDSDSIRSFPLFLFEWRHFHECIMHHASGCKLLSQPSFGHLFHFFYIDYPRNTSFTRTQSSRALSLFPVLSSLQHLALCLRATDRQSRRRIERAHTRAERATRAARCGPRQLHRLPRSHQCRTVA